MNFTSTRSRCLMIRQIVVAQSLLLVHLRKCPCSPMTMCTMVTHYHAHMPPGFAMGGALAGAVVSGMLADSYMNKEVLESRVACITFGHPLVADCAQQDLVEKGGLHHLST